MKRLRFGSYVLVILGLSIVCWTGSIAGDNEGRIGGGNDQGDVLHSIILKEGEPAPEDGKFWTDQGAFDLTQVFALTNIEIDRLDAKIQLLESQKQTLNMEILYLHSRIRDEELQVEIEDLKCPGWLEQHIGWSAGAGGGMCLGSNGSEAAAFVGVIYGYQN